MAAKRKRQYHQGVFTPKNPGKYVGDVTNIVYRSSWELRFLIWLDLNPSVIMYSSEEFKIPYYSKADGKSRTYYPDFMVQFKAADGGTKTVLVEIKPADQVKPPKQTKRKKPETYLQELYDWQVNQDKWEAAEQWSKERGIEFRVFTEYDLGLKKR